MTRLRCVRCWSLVAPSEMSCAGCGASFSAEEIRRAEARTWRERHPTDTQEVELMGTADQISSRLADKEKSVFLHRAAWYERTGFAYLIASWIVCMAIVIVVLWP